jgi:hypothetical protein
MWMQGGEARVHDLDAVVLVQRHEALVHGVQQVAQAVLRGAQALRLLLDQALQPLGVLLHPAAESHLLRDVADRGDRCGVLSVAVGDGRAVEQQHLFPAVDLDPNLVLGSDAPRRRRR